MRSPGREFQELQAWCIINGQKEIRNCFAWLGEFLGRWVGLSGSSHFGTEGTRGNPWDQGGVFWKRKGGGHKLCIHM